MVLRLALQLDSRDTKAHIFAVNNLEVTRLPIMRTVLHTSCARQTA